MYKIVVYMFTAHEVDTANLGLRLVASTVTSFLILALLLFMIHRLRQKRLLIMMRREYARDTQQSRLVHRHTHSPRTYEWKP